MIKKAGSDMKKKRGFFGVLFMITALIIMQLPVPEADAATSASDFKMEGTTLVKYKGTDSNVSVPDDVEVIGEGAFEELDHIELVVLPNSVKRIDPYAFWGCDSLEKVVLGRGINHVGDFAFANCTGLTDMSIPENVRSIGIQAFADCVNMTDIKIPTQVISIHETAFDGCGKLIIHCEKGSFAEEYARSFYEKQKDMPEYEALEEDSAKQQETMLPDPTASPEPTVIPESYDGKGTTLGSSSVVGNHAMVFMDNTEPTVFGKTDNSVPNHNSSEENTDLVGEEIVTKTTDIQKFCIVDGSIVADQAYYRSDRLAEVLLSEGIKEIGQFSFARSSLTKMTMPNTIEKICYGAFYHCDALAEVELPDSIMNVEPKAFKHTAWVKEFETNNRGEAFLISGGVLVAYTGSDSSVTLPEGIRVIAAEVFLNHSEIERVVLPDSLVVIGEGAFENCSNLSELIFGKHLEKVKDRAFAGCKLNKITLPESVREIGLKAFDESEEIGYNGELPQRTYEVSAQRLSNESYRVYSYDEDNAGIEVEGMQNAYAELSGADKRYALQIKEVSKSTQMEAAFERNMQSKIPEMSYIFDLLLTDSSDIPITKLGKQRLTLTMPVPENLKGQELKVLILDRNGQPNELMVQQLTVDGAESIRFQTGYVSQIIIY